MTVAEAARSEGQKTETGDDVNAGAKPASFSTVAEKLFFHASGNYNTLLRTAMMEQAAKPYSIRVFGVSVLTKLLPDG